MPAIIKWNDIWGKPKTFPSAGSTDPMGLGFAMAIDPCVLSGLVTQGAAGRCLFTRLRNGGTITKVGFTVGTQSGNVGVAAYSNSGSGRTAVPGARLATSGTVACPASGWAEVSLGTTITVQPGDWLALACDNTTATFGGGGNAANASAANGLVGYQDTSAFPPPVTPALAAYGGRMLVLVGVP